jgi:NADH-quinone oxidoreductase subunit L
MLNFLYLIPALPFAGFLILALVGKRMPKTGVAIIGAGSVGLSAIVTLAVGASFIASPPEGHVFTQTLWTWMEVGDFAPSVSFSLDALSLLMIFVITVVGFFIHLYSTEFMQDEEGYSRFFAYLNLFVGAMLTLVLADNLLLLYLGWEGVGLCSYLLIGFWYADPANGRAARKAFITTRAGDTAMVIGLFLLFNTFGTLNIRELLQEAPLLWLAGHPLAVTAAALLLGGAVGKSAQLPLQTWLPDAMAGPTPVSALIHAATMVTAGVYLIARMNVLFTLAPMVQLAVAVIGAVTLLLAGVSALAQKDIKRVLAYSTISQIGYMFLALGVGAWSAAMFHFMTHAFFKALLFLGAGVVINALHHEHDLFKMGGLRRRLPVAFWTFLIGAGSLAALPFVTGGFYSKDLILWDTWASPLGNRWLWLAGTVGAFITTLYTFRMLFLAFFGEEKTPVSAAPGRRMEIPLLVLAAFSTVAGVVELPPLLGDYRPFSEFLRTTLPGPDLPHEDRTAELSLLLVTTAGQIAAFLIAYRYFLPAPLPAERLVQKPVAGAVHRFWFSGWGFDWLYDKLFVRPFVWIARVNKGDFLDLIYTGIALLNRLLHSILSQTQTGRVRWYAAGIAVGAVIVLGMVAFLQ